MVASREQEHNGSKVAQKLSVVHRVMPHAALALVEVTQSQRAAQEHTGLECLLVEDQMAAKSLEEDRMADPLVEVGVSTLLQERMGLVVDLPWAVAGLGTETPLHSLEYCGVTQALVGQSLACRSMLGCGLCWLPVQWRES